MKKVKTLILTGILSVAIAVPAFGISAWGNMTTSSKDAWYQNGSWLTRLNITSNVAWSGTYANAGTAAYCNVTLYGDTGEVYGRKSSTYALDATTYGMTAGKFAGAHTVTQHNGAVRSFITGYYTQENGYN